MLVVSRKVDQSIVIGDDIVLTVSKVAGNRVVVLIDAPREVRIKRGELKQEPKEDGIENSTMLDRQNKNRIDDSRKNG